MPANKAATFMTVERITEEMFYLCSDENPRFVNAIVDFSSTGRRVRASITKSGSNSYNNKSICYAATTVPAPRGNSLACVQAAPVIGLIWWATAYIQSGSAIVSDSPTANQPYAADVSVGPEQLQA